MDHVLFSRWTHSASFLDFFCSPFLYTESGQVKVKFPRLEAGGPNEILVL